MECPQCGATDTRVIDSRPAESGQAIRRRRNCERCGGRFTTYERPEPQVRKRDGRIESFSPAKLGTGVSAALADRPVSGAAIQGLIARVEAEVRRLGNVVDTEQIGRRVLEGLRDLDEVAYLRFASVYKEFKGAADFEREVASLESAD